MPDVERREGKVWQPWLRWTDTNLRGGDEEFEMQIDGRTVSGLFPLLPNSVMEIGCWVDEPDETPPESAGTS